MTDNKTRYMQIYVLGSNYFMKEMVDVAHRLQTMGLIGGNVLIEMGQAYVNNKKIFFLYGMSSGLSYQDEVDAMDPICLLGDLENIKKYA